MMDLDFFKKINDTYGHLAGDQALVFLATLLKEVVGEAALPIRYAGDEFMILLPDSENRTALEMGGTLLQRVPKNTWFWREREEKFASPSAWGSPQPLKTPKREKV